MKKRLLSLLLCLSFVLGLVPTAALATDEETANSLTPADKYYTLDGESEEAKPEAGITLSKTAVANANGTYTVTLTAKADQLVTLKDAEVTFVLDASQSMQKDDGNAQNETRWKVATSAIQKMDANLSKVETKHYVYFNSKDYVSSDKYATASTSTGTNLIAGVTTGIDQFTDPSKKHVLIIVSDGEANYNSSGNMQWNSTDDCYPTTQLTNFKNQGGIVYTVGFNFSDDRFKTLASTDCSYNATDDVSLNKAFDSITTKIAGLISDTMGEKVELVEDTITVDGDGYTENSECWVENNTLYWTCTDGLRNMVTLTYKVQLTEAAKKEAAESGLKFALNKEATLNYDYAVGDTEKEVHVAFPIPSDTLSATPKTANLTYVYNNGNANKKETKTLGEEVTLEKPEYTGYTFKGWHLKEDLSDNAVEKVTMNEDKAVYAEWEQIMCTLTYDSQGGAAVKPTTVAYGEPVDVNGETTKTGYTFKGWYETADCTGDAITKIEKLTENKIVYAKWEKNDYTLTYVFNDGSTEDLVENHKYLDKVTVDDKKPTRDGYTFAGWYSDKDLTKKVSEVTMDDNKVVYAKWDQIFYTLNYEANGGSAVKSKSVAANAATDVDGKTTKDGYKFLGWYSDEKLTTPITKIEKMTGDVTVYAKWDQIYYKLNYETNGGSAVESKSVAANAATDVDGKTTMDGYKFLGWYSDKELTKPISKIEKMTGDVTVYAKWEQITYTLTYVSNGGTEFDAETYPEGKEVALDKIPTKSGFTFTGWFADAALTQLLTKVTMDANKTVYAGWKEDETPILEKGDHSAYIIGYKDGTVQPDRNISRAEVATIFFRLLTDDAREKYWSSTNEYTDVKDSDWCNNAISTLSNMGILKGYKDGTFKPSAPVTRAEFAAIAARFNDGAADEYATFSDVAKDYWASKEIAKATNLGWIKGYTDGTFRPEKEITRGEVMILVNRVLERDVDEKGLGEYAKEWKDVQPGSWCYYAVQEATNSHEYARTDKPIDGQSYCYEEWTKTKENRDWAALEKIWKNEYEAN